MSDNRRPNRVQRRDLHSSKRASSNAYTGSGDRLNISATPSGPARGHLDGFYPGPTIRDGVVSASKLDPTGASDGSGFVYNGITEAFELTTVCTGSGIIGRIPYRATHRILGDSPFSTDGSTVGLGTGQVINVHLFVQPSASAGTLVKLSHIGDSGKCLDVVSSNTGVTGIDVAMTSAATGATGVNVTYGGVGTAVGVTASGDYGLRVSATSVRPTTSLALFQNTNAANTATLVEVASNGVGRTFYLNRSNSAATQAACEIFDALPTAQAALRVSASSSVGAIVATNGGAGATIDATATGAGTAISASISNSSSASNVLYATTNGSGDVFSAINAGTGRVLRGEITNASSTADAMYLAHAGNGRAAQFYRNVSGAAADLVTMSASDAGRVLRVTQSGGGKGVTVSTVAGSGLEVVAGTGFAGIFSSDGPGGGSPNQVYICNGAGGTALQAAGRVVISDSEGTGNTSLIVTRGGTGGQAIMAVGGIRSDTVRITSGSPDVGKSLVATDTLGNSTWDWPRGADTDCLVSQYQGSNALGNIVFAPANAPVQVPLDLTTTPLPAAYICNDQWDTSSNLGGFTPTKTLDPLEAATDGTVRIEVHLTMLKPAGWTASDVALWIDVDGVKVRIDTVHVVAGQIHIHLHGVRSFKFNGSNTYKIFATQNAGAFPNTVTTWDCNVFTNYLHTPGCLACTS